MISPYIYEAEKIFIDFSIYWNKEEKYLSFYGIINLYQTLLIIVFDRGLYFFITLKTRQHVK